MDNPKYGIEIMSLHETRGESMTHAKELCEQNFEVKDKNYNTPLQCFYFKDDVVVPEPIIEFINKYIKDRIIEFDKHGWFDKVKPDFNSFNGVTIGPEQPAELVELDSANIIIDNLSYEEIAPAAVNAMKEAKIPGKFDKLDKSTNDYKFAITLGFIDKYMELKDLSVKDIFNDIFIPTNNPKMN